MRARIGLTFSLAVASCFLLHSTAAQAIIFADGSTHTIDASNSYPFEGVEVRDGAGATPTTVNLLAGGQLGGLVSSRERSNINFLGGTYSGEFSGLSIATVTGGSQGGMTVTDSATLTVSGGIINFGIASDEQSRVTVLGGSIHSLTIGGEAELHGGTVTGDSVTAAVATDGLGRISIFGGTFSGVVARDQSIVTIFGSAFNLPLGDITALSGTLTGVLSDGTPLNVTFGRASTASINLVPEPSTGALAIAGILALTIWRKARGATA